MQFGCESCKTQLQIADEKVRGKRLIVRCKRCGAKIAISDPLLSGAHAPRLVSSGAPAASRPPQQSAARAAAHRSAETQPDPESTRAMESDVLEKALQASREETVLQNGARLQPVSHAPPEDAAWFAMIHGKQTGPLTQPELVERVGRGEVGPRTYLWREGMDSWQRARDLPEVATLLPAPPASQPAPQDAGARETSPARDAGLPHKGPTELVRWASDELTRTPEPAPAQQKPARRAANMFESAARASTGGPFAVFVVLVALAAAAIVLWLVLGTGARKAEPSNPPEPAKVAPPPAPVQTVPAPANPADPPKPAETTPSPGPAAQARPIGLTAEQVRQKLDENKSALQGCVDEALRRDPNLRVGKIHIAATIAPSGQVSDARIDRPSVEEAPLGACLRRATRRIAFPRFSGEPFEVDIPIVVSAGQ